MNPKNWHIELRHDSDLQEVLLEDDIFTCTEQEALAYLFSWQDQYIKAFSPDTHIIAVCTSNWTQETVYQTLPCA